MEKNDSEKSNITEKRQTKPAKNQLGKKRLGITTLIVGLIACIAGLAFLLVNLFTEPRLRDAEYIVDTGSWARVDEPSVIWNFTEIGKGTLTTNNHENDYDFIWAISGDTLEIETEWLYTTDDKFVYRLDQENQILILNDEIEFRPAGGVDAEITEDD
ncbi:hypothetical protein IJG90_03210 [Candidatus Saccharibacteria bacterium]|nr:hypothetical protein [Candidatus Saccharibacteria bacterium]